MQRNRIILTLLFAALLAGGGQARAQRGLPGQMALGISAGTVDGFIMRDANRCYRFWGAIEAVRYSRNHTYWNFSSELLRKDYLYRGVRGPQVVPMAQFTGEAGYNFPLVSDRGRNIALTAGLAALAGYETSGWGDKRLADGATLTCEDSFIYGPALTATLEGYLSDRVILLVRVRERCTFGSATGKFHTQLGFGLRFIIN